MLQTSACKSHQLWGIRRATNLTSLQGRLQKMEARSYVKQCAKPLALPNLALATSGAIMDLSCVHLLLAHPRKKELKIASPMAFWDIFGWFPASFRLPASYRCTPRFRPVRGDSHLKLPVLSCPNGVPTTVSIGPW